MQAHDSLHSEHDAVDELSFERGFDWGSADWPGIYRRARRRNLELSPWLINAGLLVLLAPLGVALNPYLPVLMIIAAVCLAVLGLRLGPSELLVVEAKVHAKFAERLPSSDEPRSTHSLQVLIRKEGTLDSSGEIWPSEEFGGRLQTFEVDSFIYDRYDRDDMIVVLCSRSGRVLMDVRA